MAFTSAALHRRFLINPSCSLHLRRPIWTNPEKTRNLSSDQSNIAWGLVSIFTRQPFSEDDPELKKLAPKLTTKIVEAALNGFNRWRLAYMFFTWASNQEGYRNDIYTYNAMAFILSRARQNAPLRALAVDVMNSRCCMSPGALGFMIRCLGSAGLVEEANSLFDRVKMMGLCVPNVYSYNCLLEAISKAGSCSVELVEMRLRQMRDFGLHFDKFTLTPVLQVYCNTGNFDKTLAVFNEILDRGWVDEHFLTVLVVSFCKWSEVDKAFELIERMEERNVKLNYRTYCVLIHGFVKESRIDKALRLFEKMCHSGFKPDVALYDVMMGGLCKHKKLEKALCLYSEMKRMGIMPDSGIVKKLISSFSEEGELTRVVEEIVQDIDEKSVTFLYKSVLECFARTNSVEKGYNFLLGIMENDDSIGISRIHKLLNDHKKLVCPDYNSFSVVINGLLKRNRLDLAIRLFHDMVSRALKPNVMIYNNIIEGMCREGRLEESLKLLENMKEAGVKPTQFTLNSIYGHFCERRDVEGALELVRKMRFHGFEPWIKHSTLLVKKLCQNGKAVEACKFLGDVVREGFLSHIVAYTAAIDGFFKIGEVDEALALFKDMCARGYCPDVIAYNVLIKGLCKGNRVAEAENLLNEMVLKGLTPSIVTYNNLIDGWCQKGQIDCALNCLSRICENEGNPNVITYTTLIHGFCTAQRPDDALVLWNEMRKQACSPNRITFMALIQGLCKCGRTSEALVYFHEMVEREIEPDTTVYVTLISSFLSNENVLSAFEVFKKMVHRGGFPDLQDKNYLIVGDAVKKFLEDPRTSSYVRNLAREGRVPAIDCSASVTGK